MIIINVFKLKPHDIYLRTLYESLKTTQNLTNFDSSSTNSAQVSKDKKNIYLTY